MKKVPSITAAEWTVMKVLWRNAPLIVLEVAEALEGEVDWHPKTVRTLMTRLLDKGAIRREKRGGVYRYSPCVTEEQCVRAESTSFLSRCFSGKAQPMLAHFIEHENLSADDIARLRAKLDERARQEEEHG
jgi:BlaI family transcriptional regulator, penicillinase repressor